MPYFFIILLKINLVLVLFAAAYYLILRRLTFYTINRVFLVFGILFSSLYPFINLTDFFNRQRQINQEVVAFVPKLNQKVNALVPANFITNHWQLISILFYVGVALMALRLIVQFVSLYKMHQKSAPGDIANFKVRILAEAVSPFSFWQTVYINPSLHQEKELHTILAHEQIHVKQWHSLDIILAELSVVFYWFNPGVWLMKKAVKENLEFITDQKILNKGIDKKTYQYSLLDVGNLTPAVAIVNNFNLSDLKKRIKMMNGKRSSRLTLSRYLLVTPLLLIITLAFTVSKKEMKKQLMPLRRVLVSTHLIEASQTPSKTVIIKNQTARKRINHLSEVKKTDSTNKLSVFIRTLFIDTDSTIHGMLPDLPEMPAGLVLKGMITGAKNTTTKQRVFFYRTDSTGNDEVKNIKDIQFQLRTGEHFSPENMEKERVVVVKGYGRTAKSLDTAMTRGNVVYFVNGKKITSEELKAIKPEEIKNVIIQKRLHDAGVQVELKEKL